MASPQEPSRAPRARSYLRRLLASFTLVLLAAALLIACGGDDRSSSAGNDDGGSADTRPTSSKSPLLRMGILETLDDVNPFAGSSGPTYYIDQYVYPHLVQYDTELELSPYMAESWELSEDKKSMTLQIVADAKWSDGQPLTAEDAAWTINTVIEHGDTGAASFSGTVDHITKAEATSPTELVLTFDAAYPTVLHNLFLLPILPKHIWEKHTGNDGNDLRTYKPEQSLPIVSGGPFMISELDPDQNVILTRNPNWYGEKPLIETFGLQFYTNADALVAALKAGQLDAAVQLPASSIPALEDASNLKVEVLPRNQIAMIGANANPKKPENRELLDTKVRTALAHAIDAERIVEVAFNGAAEAGGGLLPTANGDAHHPELEAPEYDIELANRLLDEAGMKRGSDGVRVTPEGEPMEYPIITNVGVAHDPRMFDIVQQGFAKVGVKVRQRHLQNSLDEALAPDGKTLYADFYFDVYGSLVDPSFLLSIVTCDALGGLSDTAFCDPEYDKLYEEQATIVDPEERLQAVYEAQEYIYEKKPYLHIFYPKAIYAYDKSWQGFTPVVGGQPLNLYTNTFLTNVHN